MNTCLEWTGCRNALGYGRKAYKGKSVLVHRLTYALHYGLDVFTMGGVVMHLCDNPKCYNIDHLKLGTHADNSIDKVSKGRHTKGANVWCASLSNTDVQYIKANYIPGKNRFKPGNVAELAAKFNTTKATISAAARGKYYGT